MAVDYEPLWRWVREREAIRVKKERGDSMPWTDDRILGVYRFCNVRREDDRVTVWIRQNVREAFAGHPLLWLMLCICRQINWPDTIEELIHGEGSWPVDGGFDPMRLAAVLSARKERGDKVYTGAYVIPAPSTRGADKQAYVAGVVVGDLWRRRDEFADWSLAAGRTLEGTHARIRRSTGWGAFLAYQAVVDMRFTPLLGGVSDVATWAAAGPGTIRGLNRLHGRPLGSSLSQSWALGEMREIYALAPSATGVLLDFSDVPNILCETDKYLRVLGDEGRPRALYVPGRGS